MKCIYCGKEIPKDAPICPHCKAAIPVDKKKTKEK